MLSQTWVRISCTSLGQHSPLRGILRIRRITLLHPKHIAVLNNEWIAGSTKNEADLVRSLNLLEKKPQRVCGRDESGEPASLCVAALRLENDLLAVWLVGRESGIEELVRDSSAIKAFIKYGISETENYPALEKAIKSIK